MSALKLFRNRTEAGERLAAELAAYAGRADVLVLALPRGGIPVAFEIAKSLGAPLDVFVVRKLGVPGQQELAMGAIAAGGVQVLDAGVVGAFGIPGRMIEAVAAREQREVERRERLYRGGSPPHQIEGRVAILVDDGIATGSTMRAAIAALAQHRPTRVVVAVPVAATSTCAQLRNRVDEFVCLAQPESFFAVGQWYEDFGQVTDAQAQRFLDRIARVSGSDHA